MDLTTVDGLPLHPLIVHAVVILLPLAALCALLIAIRPVWRRRFGWPVLALTVAGVVAVPVAQVSGEQLQAALGVANPLIQRHADLGTQLLPYALAFGVLLVAFLVAGRLADRESAAGTAPATWRRVAVAAAVLVAAAGVASTVQVVRIGHSGATAVWNGVGTNR
ncbi:MULTISPECIES: DUF2231 domain-containing protein [unclassified Crossiella]|uniref:DUF2231 domain-containing protein n=1 Tax=unclassified Crossiella TaxID=2620835 RepID=UPI001FFE7D65|nr:MULTISPECIES: DUF2231 domain-containing protein [unclassified Crossiella]MCK2245296.1 hypothetical protein [Crossiella sp. S99.2]MCK2259002.1 hypothetical protein [Crossiella sp. S99.1]